MTRPDPGRIPPRLAILTPIKDSYQITDHRIVDGRHVNGPPVHHTGLTSGDEVRASAASESHARPV